MVYETEYFEAKRIFKQCIRGSYGFHHSDIDGIVLGGSITYLNKFIELSLNSTYDILDRQEGLNLRASLNNHRDIFKKIEITSSEIFDLRVEYRNKLIIDLAFIDTLCYLTIKTKGEE